MRPLVVVYGVLAAVGLVGTWWFNLASAAAGEDYLGGWFGTAVAFVLPLFLALREHSRRATRQEVRP